MKGGVYRMLTEKDTRFFTHNRGAVRLFLPIVQNGHDRPSG